MNAEFPRAIADAPGIPCPACGNVGSEVRDSRPSLASVRRRRQCSACGTRYRTAEVLLPDRVEVRQLMGGEALRAARNLVEKLEDLARHYGALYD